jgi:hypothetical protein
VSSYLAALDVAGDADAWREAGFAVDNDDRIRVGHVRLHLGVGVRGIESWHLVDEPPDLVPTVHPNGVTQLDHLVVFTDDPQRTTTRYAGLGLDARRVRDVGNGRTQTFFRAGEVIIELVGPVPDVDGERFWGLALTVADLDACAVLLGERLGPIKDAVQPGRRIATLRHKECGLTVPIAFMSGEET